MVRLGKTYRGRPRQKDHSNNRDYFEEDLTRTPLKIKIFTEVKSIG